jgi:hypothetical protein
MPALRTSTRERRRDPRFQLSGSVRLVLREPLAALEGDLVDVSAGGLRVHADDASAGMLVGQSVGIEVTLRDLGDPSRPPTIRLRGRGDVVRRERAVSGGSDLAVRLGGPLGFREDFASLRVF